MSKQKKTDTKPQLLDIAFFNAKSVEVAITSVRFRGKAYTAKELHDELLRLVETEPEITSPTE